MARFSLFLFLLTLAGCAVDFTEQETPPEEKTKPVATLTRTDFNGLPGWTTDAHQYALAAFLRSCAVFAKKPANVQVGPDSRFGRVADWLPVCQSAAGLKNTANPTARLFFETWFLPYQVTEQGGARGLITGYFEPQLEGAWQPSTRYSIPLYKRPGDIVSADLGDFNPEWEGRKLVGRVQAGKFVPYHNRREIASGSLKGRGLELMWLNDPIDAFILHVQGSGRVRMSDGKIVRVGFAGRNGHPYTAIGRVLIARGALKSGEVTLQSIRAWLAAHPDDARTVMNENASYIFFRLLKGDGPIGAQGVALTPRRSLAIDRAYLPLGAPIWLSTADPINKTRPLTQLMIAQDTGSAIKGAVRGDFFWGAGAAARERAGRMNAAGTFHILLPRALAIPPS